MNPKVQIEDEDDYAAVVEELRQRIRREGIWARAVAESDGDMSKAQARYIKYRVETLKEERRLKEEEARQLLQRADEWRARGWIAGAKILGSAALLAFLLVILFRGCIRS